MKRSPSSPVDGDSSAVRVALITLDHHMTNAVDEARALLAADIPGLELTIHAATDWDQSAEALLATREAIANAHIIFVSMLFLEDHIKAIQPDLEARREACDAMICCMSASEIVKLTRIGKFRMDKEAGGITGLLKKLRGKRDTGANDDKSAGERQMRMLRRLPKILRFIPGTAQDVRVYFLSLQYRLSASSNNIANLVRLLVDRYCPKERIGSLKIETSAPTQYPDVGIYHPEIPNGGMSGKLADHPAFEASRPTVGLLLLRSYLLSGDTGHYDGVIRAFEAKGFNAVAVFCNGLDMRPAIDAFLSGGADGYTIDALVSLTGFSLVGGPAYSDADAAARALGELDVPYITAHVTEFQSIEAWENSSQGLLPIETTIMVAIPELDGATGSQVFGGRSAGETGDRRMLPHAERVETLVARTAKLIALRRKARAERKLAITIFNFPPNAGNIGTAAFLSVFESLHATLRTLKEAGYNVDTPESVDKLRDAVIKGNAAEHGASANVHAVVSTETHVRKQKWLPEIEAQWGPAPGRQQASGQGIHILGAAFGNVLVNVQPGFGYEGDPMRLLFEKGFAPTHAFAANYRYLREEFGADAVLHFGTHGALEFMPGKQTGMSSACWPDRLIGDLPNFYLYAANNPSEATIAKRRSAATMVSYLTPPLSQSGLYKGLAELKASLERLRGMPPEETSGRADLVDLVRAQAEAVDLIGPADDRDMDTLSAFLTDRVREVEHSLIPDGLHVLGKSMKLAERSRTLRLMAGEEAALEDDQLLSLAAGDVQATDSEFAQLAKAGRHLACNQELDAIVHALDARFVQPSPSGDLARTPDILPTGRNIHGFDPFRIPSAFAVRDGAMQAARVLERHLELDGALPETIALVLWGTDNLKTEGGPIAQAMALMGARPRQDSYGRVAGAELIDLDELKRPRIDVVMTLSGIFRDLLPLQSKMLAEASYLAAVADEPEDQNFIRKHALAYAAAEGCDVGEAALRVFSNADGAYGSNVNYLISSSAWSADDEIADTYTSRKSFAISHKGETSQRTDLLQSVLGEVDMAYQNLDSVELGVTTIDNYFDTLGGITKAIAKEKGNAIPVYISDQTQGSGRVRTLNEQVDLESRTRSLNPKWFEGMLEHGFEGVRQIESQISNTFGWSATTGNVSPWVYERFSETFVLDDDMRKRLADLNPHAASRMTERLLEASERKFWEPDAETLAALQDASDELEDRIEGIEPMGEAAQ